MSTIPNPIIVPDSYRHANEAWFQARNSFRDLAQLTIAQLMPEGVDDAIFEMRESYEFSDRLCFVGFTRNGELLEAEEYDEEHGTDYYDTFDQMADDLDFDCYEAAKSVLRRTEGGGQFMIPCCTP